MKHDSDEESVATDIFVLVRGFLILKLDKFMIRERDETRLLKRFQNTIITSIVESENSCYTTPVSYDRIQTPTTDSLYRGEQLRFDLLPTLLSLFGGEKSYRWL